MPATRYDDSQIAEAAYFLWLEEGQPEGRDMDHWLQAASALTPVPKSRKPRAKAAAAKAPAAKTASKPAAKPRRKKADA